MQVINQKALTDVSERLRDTKRSVRRDAAMHLMAVFRYAIPCLQIGISTSKLSAAQRSNECSQLLRSAICNVASASEQGRKLAGFLRSGFPGL